jgi:galactitol-specific phosphotransferase system IIB component
MQSNRSAGDVDVADMENSGESIAKAWIADLIISINRTKKEAEDGTTRLYVVKNRTGIARFTIKIKTDFQRMQFVVQDRLEVADV